MIVRMRKFAFMVYHKEYASFLESLRSMGVLHVIQKQAVAENETIQSFVSQRKRISIVSRQFATLNQHNNVTPQEPQAMGRVDGLSMLDHIEELMHKRSSLNTQLQVVEKEIDEMSVWGNFKFEDIDRLKEAGYVVRFFSCSSSKFDPQWIALYNATVINCVQSVDYFITITKGDISLEIDAETPRLPAQGLAKLDERKSVIEKELAELQADLNARAASEYNNLLALDVQIQNEYNYSNVIEQTEVEANDTLMLLEGWVPEEQSSALTDALDKDGYYYLPMEIEEEDNVPIKLKNNRFAKLFEPITLLFSLPNYNEFDPTPFFAPFFMMFFGFCFGDAGYGLLIVLVATILKFKLSDKVKPYLSLFQFFGLSTVVFGLLSGSFFGINLVQVDALISFKEYFLDRDNLMTLSIVLGIMQIIFGKSVAAAQVMAVKGFKYGIAPIAWIVVVLAGLGIYGLPMLDIAISKSVETVFSALAVAGMLVAFVYNTPGKNIFLNIGTGVWNAYNMASGLLGDTLSYIRLFAIGLTGGILGGVFNDLAFSMTDGMNIVLRVLVVLLILVMGHTINFCLCMISSLVHPIRLTFVEYYKNAEFAGGGKPYKPFKQELKED